MNFYRLISGSLVLTVFILFLLFPCSVKAEKDFITVNKSNNTISVNIIETDISEVASVLSDKAGVKIFLDDSISRTITSKFRDISLELGIKRLLGPGVSSAFVFVEDKSVSGKADYRLDTVKIFDSGNMLSANFRVFDKGVVEKDGKKTSVSTSGPGLQKRLPGTPGAIRHEIFMAKKNLDIIRKKNRAETDYAKNNIASMKMKLSKKFSTPDERAKLAKSLSRAKQNLARITNLNSRIITDEEKNLRMLVEEKEKIESQRKFAEREREVEKQRSLMKKAGVQ